MSRRPKRQSRKSGSADPSRIRGVNWLLTLPRSVKIVLNGGFALSVTLALFPVVDEIYIRLFFNENTVIAPALVSVSFGLVMYLAGWMLIVGTVGEHPPARLAVLWYCGIGILAVFVVILLVIQGIMMLD